jgi:hypothetical protein
VIVFGSIQQERPTFVTSDRALADAARKEKFDTQLVA